MLDHTLTNARLMIVDDQQANIALLQAIFQQAGYTEITCTDNPHQAVDVFHACQPDLVLLDLMMPELDGFAVIEQIKLSIPSELYLPIVVLTADITRESRHRALASGAKDFLTKPIDAVEVLLRVQNLLETRRLHQRIFDQNQILEERVHERTQELENAQTELEHAYNATLEAWSLLLDLRDNDTEGHSQRVTAMSLRLAHALGLSVSELVHIQRGALLHDIGKMGVPDAILHKPGPLDDEEWSVMRKHPVYAYETLSGIPFLSQALDIPHYHHEKWDGSGYPCGLKGEQIPLAARIFAIVDIWDALRSDRPYRKGWPEERVRLHIRELAGAHLDPHIVEVFLELPIES